MDKILELIPLVSVFARLGFAWYRRERGRGQTPAEIFEAAGLQFEANEAALLDDLTRLDEETND